MDKTVLFLIIQLLSEVNKVKFLCITNNLFKHQSLVCTQLNDQTVLLQTSQFHTSYLFALSLNVKQFYLTHK